MKTIKVSYLGLNSLFGRVTTNLLKQSPCIHKLTLYDDGAPPHAIEHPNVFFGRDSLQDAIKDVNIVVIGDEGGELQEKDRLRIIGPKVIRYTEAIVKFSPNAIVIVAATPLNILFPLIGNFLGPDWHDRLLGTTSVDTLRASRTLDGLLNDQQGQTHILPVIGGASYSTRVPLFSHVCPQITVSNDIRDKIIEKTKLFDCSDSRDMDAIERAYTTVRFIHSVLMGMTRDTSVPEIAMTKTSGVPQTNYFSLPILIGRKGIERAADLPKLDAIEEKLFFEAAQKLSEESEKALVLSKQFSDENEAEDLKKQTLLKLRNTEFHEVEGKQLASELQLKMTCRDPMPYSHRGGRSRKRLKSARKNLLALPCAEATLSSPRIIKKYSKNGHRYNIAEAGPNSLKDEPVSEYSEILNKDVTNHLNSLNFDSAGIQQKNDSLDENTDSDFSETLQLEAEEHLNSLKHRNQPHNLNSQSKHVETMDSGVGAEVPWGASNQFGSSSTDKLDSSRPVETSKNTANISSTPFKRMDKAIVDSKSVKFRLNSAKSAENPNALPTPKISPSVRVDNAIVASKMRYPVNDSTTGLDLAQLEGEDAKKEQRTEGSLAEKTISVSPAESNQIAKMAPVEVQNVGQMATGDAEKELRPPVDTTHRPGSRSQNVNLAVSDDAKKELRPRDNEFGENTRAETQDASMILTADTKMEKRPRNHSAVIKTKTANTEMTADTKKELRPQEKFTDKYGSPNFNQNDKKPARLKVPISKVRGKVNSQVVDSFEPDWSFGDHMSKSQKLMLKRNKKNDEKGGSENKVRLVGEAGNVSKTGNSGEAEIKNNYKIFASNRIQDNSEMTSDEMAASKDSVAKSRSLKVRSAGRTNRKAVPSRRSSDKRKHGEKNKMVLSGGKRKARVEAEEATKESEEKPVLAESTSEPVRIAPNVSTNTPKRINSAITDMKVRTPTGRAENRNLNQYRPPLSKFSDKTPNSIQTIPNTTGTLTAKRIDSSITDVKTSARQRSPSPKAVNFIPSHKQPDVSSHLLTDTARVAKLNSIHKTNAEVFNIEKTTEKGNVRVEPDFKVDVRKKLQNSENEKQVRNSSATKPKPQTSDQPKSSRKMAEDTEDHRNHVGNLPEKDLTSDKTMNYFMRQQRKGPVDQNNLESEEKPLVERPKHTKRKSGRKEGKTDKLKKHRRPKHQMTKDVSKMDRNSEHCLNNSKTPNQPDKVTPQKQDVTKKESGHETDDPWDSKYFTKASEMFFKMFRDTVTSTPPIYAEGNNARSDSHQPHDVFLQQPQKNLTEMKANNPFQSEQAHQNDAPGAHGTQKMESQYQVSKNVSEAVKSGGNGAINAVCNPKAVSKNGKVHRKVSPGKVNIRFDKGVKCKIHPEASTKTTDMCENVKFHVSTRHPSPNYKGSPTEIPQNSNKESTLSFDKLYEESSTVPIITGAKGDKSWRSMETGKKVRIKSVTSDFVHGVVATSDKGRGDALNEVDFTVCKMQDQCNLGRGAPKVGESSKNGSHGVLNGPKTAPVKIPILSKTIKQVAIPYHVGVMAKNAEDAPKLEKSFKWERVVNVFKNIIISDIEGKRPKFLLDTPQPTEPTISTASIAKPVPSPKKPEPKMVPQEANRAVFKVKSKSEHAQKRKYETAKKKRPSEPKRAIIKNNPKKIVNYFSKRGASASSYERPRFDGRSFDQQEGLMSRTSVNMGQSSTSFASPSKIK